jgi:predicted nucleotidyltransferase
MQSELDILRDVTRKLSVAEIAHMLTGSVAMNYYTRPRMTRDIDIVVSLHRKDVDTIVNLFANDYYVDRNAVSRAIDNESLFNLIHNEAVIKVDCIIRKKSEYRHLEFERRKEVEIEGIKVWIVSKEDLIISKLYWARDSHSEFQLRDVKNLLASGYDGEYLEHWTRKLNLHDLLNECLHE